MVALGWIGNASEMKGIFGSLSERYMDLLSIA